MSSDCIHRRIRTHRYPDTNQVSEPDCQRIYYLTFAPSKLGESPPPAPRACFGRDGLVEEVVALAENLTPIALIGAGGIGKTSIALTVLHHDRVKQRFGDNRRFIRCDQFTTSCAHFLTRLSKAIGAGIENPEELTDLRPFLSSKDILIVLDNAESILDPRGMDAQEIYDVVEELSQIDNVCLCITSRVSTVPSDCETLEIPTLSIEAARDAFYRIYKNGEQANLVDNILEQLDFHPLSITLLATVAHHNKWNADRLTKEWGSRRTSVLQTEHNKSLAAAIELSLASPMFRELGPDARGVLGAVAFFPQGVDENNLDWLFPTIPNGANLLDKFCILSLTYRSNGFVMMLAPLRDHLSPEDPKASRLLCMAKELYFARVSVCLNPNKPEFGESRWIVSEDVNVEHLLDVFSSSDTNSDDVWKACASFMRHLYWHKIRPTVLRPRIEGLPDNHPSKPDCLFELSQLFDSVGNHAECKKLLFHALKLQREQGDDRRVARTLRHLSETDRQMGLHGEGIQFAKEASGVYERFGDVTAQARCLRDLAWLLCEVKQLDAAEEAASHAIELLAEKDERYLVCGSHRVLGNVYRFKGDREKAIHHFEVALGIASSFSWLHELFQVHFSLTQLFLDEGKFDDAQAHVEHAKLHAVDHAYYLGCAMALQARVLYKQRRVEEARSEALRAVGVFENLGAAKKMEDCRNLLRDIQKELDGPIVSGQSGFDCEHS